MSQKTQGTACEVEASVGHSATCALRSLSVFPLNDNQAARDLMASPNSPLVVGALPGQIPVVNLVEELCTACSKIPLEFFENAGKRKYDHTLYLPAPHIVKQPSPENDKCSLCSTLIKAVYSSDDNLSESQTKRSLILSRPPKRGGSVYAAHCNIVKLLV